MCLKRIMDLVGAAMRALLKRGQQIVTTPTFRKCSNHSLKNGLVWDSTVKCLYSVARPDSDQADLLKRLRTMFEMHLSFRCYGGVCVCFMKAMGAIQLWPS